METTINEDAAPVQEHYPRFQSTLNARRKDPHLMSDLEYVSRYAKDNRLPPE